MPRVTFIVGYARLVVPSIRPPRVVFSQYRTKSAAAAGGRPSTEEEISLARRWLAKFNPDTIPKRVCELSFSRSSGPGGQNVNKVNSKATLRVSLDQLFPLVPALLHSHLCNSRYYAEKTNSLVIQADDSRKQSDNAHSCFVRLHSLLLEAGSRAVPGETSAAQREHVRDLQKAENERRLRGKKFASGKKAGRRAGRSDE